MSPCLDIPSTFQSKAMQIFLLILLVQIPSIGIGVSCISSFDLTLIDLVSIRIVKPKPKSSRLGQVLGRLRQKDHKVKASLGYRVSSRPAWTT